MAPPHTFEVRECRIIYRNDVRVWVLDGSTVFASSPNITTVEFVYKRRLAHYEP
jgi:hypothetical protein